ncbi:hypothetical protein VU08_01900 [Desulfobulbus sp. F5]|nr:hypothetical protein [Desulfobulbus sp. F5]
MPKGFFMVFRDTENHNTIHFKQIVLAEDEAIPDEQLKLRDDVDITLTTIRMLFEEHQEKFEEYFRSLLSLAQLGLVGPSANPSLATRALASLKQEIIAREGGRIKNQYMKELGKTSLVFGLPALLMGVLLHQFAIDLVVLKSFLFLWVGSMAGVWLSFGTRKIELSFEELNILEKDRLSHSIRLIFAGILTIVIGLFISTKAVTLELGGLSTVSFLDNIQVPLLIGIFCGMSEQILSSKVAQSANEFLGSK